FDDVGGVLGAEGFAEDVFYASRFQNGADSFSGDDAGSGGCGAEQHFCAAVMGENFVGDRGVPEGNTDHSAASHFAAFADGISDFASLAEADTDFAFAIADDDEGAEIETASAF